jgi:hypothetical protein
MASIAFCITPSFSISDVAIFSITISSHSLVHINIYISINNWGNKTWDGLTWDIWEPLPEKSRFT